MSEPWHGTLGEPYCPCGQRLDTYDELKAEGDEMATYIAEAYLGPGGFYCAGEDDVVPPEYVVWRPA